MPAATMAASPSAALGADEADRRLIAWLERTLGGEVTSIERQGRWRRAWMVEFAQGAETKRLYVRGARFRDPLNYPLRLEFEVMSLLEANGIPTPHIYGFCPDPQGIVMTNDPGQANLGTAATEEERRSVLDHYIEILAAIHKLDPAQFVPAGLHLPKTSEEIALHRLDNFEADYRAAKTRPEPLLEYLIGWVRRNAPAHRRRVSLVTGDPAQFLFRNGRVTAVIDFELSFLGDPIYDLTPLQIRSFMEPLGDLRRAINRYVDITGETIEGKVYDFYNVEYCVIGSLSAAELLTRSEPGEDMAQSLEWAIQGNRFPLELMAYHAGVDLPPLAPHEVLPARFAPMADHLVGSIRALQVAEGFQTYQRDRVVGRLADFLSYVAQHGPALERADIAETEALLDAKFDSWQAADTALESFVGKAGPEFDKALIPLFYRRMQRQLFLFEPANRAFPTPVRVLPFDELMRAS